VIFIRNQYKNRKPGRLPGFVIYAVLGNQRGSYRLIAVLP
jgi:hypothetical protein